MTTAIMSVLAAPCSDAPGPSAPDGSGDETTFATQLDAAVTSQDGSSDPTAPGSAPSRSSAKRGANGRPDAAAPQDPATPDGKVDGSGSVPSGRPARRSAVAATPDATVTVSAALAASGGVVSVAAAATATASASAAVAVSVAVAVAANAAGAATGLPAPSGPAVGGPGSSGLAGSPSPAAGTERAPGSLPGQLDASGSAASAAAASALASNRSADSPTPARPDPLPAGANGSIAALDPGATLGGVAVDARGAGNALSPTRPPVAGIGGLQQALTQVIADQVGPRGATRHTASSPTFDLPVTSVAGAPGAGGADGAAGAAGAAAMVSLPASVSAAAAVSSVSDPLATAPADVPEQLASVLVPLRATATGTHQLTVQLHPADLGPVRLVAHLDGDSITVALSSSNEAAQVALTSALPALHRSLGDAGFGSVAVSMGSSSAGTDSTGGQQARQPRAESLPAAPSATAPGSPSASGADPQGRPTTSDAALDRWL